MSNPQFSTSDTAAEAPFYDPETFDEVDGELFEQTTVGRSRKSNNDALARRQLEERREAQRLRRLLSDYAWDDHDI